jgi:SAM-dependent methyltransferase
MNDAPASWFDEEVGAYERARPSYPDAAFDALVGYLGESEITPPFDAVEIGPGSGKATKSLLQHGFRITATEPGENMSAFLRKKFSGDARLEVVHARFEDARLPDSAFDAVVSATSFGWVDERVRLPKSHALLRDYGVLAVIDTMQIASGADRGFFERCFPIYLKHRPGENITIAKTEHDVVPPALSEITGSALFADVRLRRYRWDQTYPTDVYADLVRSYSNTQMMPREAREALIADLCVLIDEEFNGYVVRPLVITVVLGRKA